MPILGAGVQDTASGTSLRTAVYHLLDYLDLRPGSALFAYEKPYRQLATAVAEAGRSRGTAVDLLAVETVTPDQLRTRLMAADKFLCAFNRTFAAGLTEHVDVMVECGVEWPERAYTLSDISADFVRILQADPRVIADLNARLIRTLQEGRELWVRDDRGTSLRVRFDPQYEWVNQDGFTEAGYALTMNLPMGEVATYTPDVEGELVFVGGLLGTIPIGRKYGPIREPVRMSIRAGRATAIDTSDRALLKDLLFCLDFDHYTRQVNEIGFGTNPAITGPVRGYNYKHEESRLGFHLGFGASLAQQNVERLTPHHLDLLLDDCQMYLDGKLLFDGDYRLDDFPASRAHTPLHVTSLSCCMPSQHPGCATK